MQKKIKLFLLMLCVYLGCLGMAETIYAADGKVSVSASATSLDIGDTVTITAKAAGPSDEQAVATMTLSFDSDVLEFQSCSSSVYGGGGNTVTVTGDSFTVTLKAVASGSSKVSLSGSDGVIFSTTEELDSMKGGSVTVKVNNAASAGSSGSGSSQGSSTNGSSQGNEDADSQTTSETKSADNSLKSLTLSEGTLSPAFAYNVVKYTATVPNSITDIAVSAETSNETATVESVTGNTGLAVGENTLQIVVKAENGVTATYTVIVTREAAETQQPAAEEEPEQASSETQENDVLDESIVINNVSYNISGSFAAETIPYDFSETTVLYHDTECRGLIYDHGTQLLIYLVQEDAAADGEKTGQFFVYDEIRDTFYPFVRLEGGFGYTIALLAPVDTQLSDTYVQTNLSVGESSISAYQVSDEFYLFYGINQEGEEGWYQYDSKEGTYQRMNTALSVTESEADETDTAADEEDEDEALQYLQQEYNSLTEAYAKEKSTSRNIIAILIFVMVILVFVLINILIRRGKEDDTEEIKQFSRSRSEDELEDKEEDIEEEQDNSEENETRETKGKEKSEKKDGIDVIDFNDF